MNTDTKPDYQIAQEKLDALFKSLEIKVEISKPFPIVKDNDWPAIGYNLIFKKGTREFKTEYFLGIGHVKWNRLPFRYIIGDNYRIEQIFEGTKKHKTWKKGQGVELIQSEIACALALEQKKTPNPAEVLGCLCRESSEAVGALYEQWVGDFGYDLDSRKGEKIFNQRRDNYAKILQIVTPDQLEELAELANQL